MFLRSSEVSWAVLARLGRVWGVPWVRPGVPEGVLEASWGHFEPSWDNFGTSWEDLGRVLGTLGSFPGPFWRVLGLPNPSKIKKNAISRRTSIS